MTAPTTTTSTAHPSTAAVDHDGGLPELAGAWRSGAKAIVAGTVVLALVGFWNSFEKVRAALEPSFGELAWTMPLLIDIGIVVFTGTHLVLAKLKMPIWWVRLIPLALIAVTVYLNVAGETDPVGFVAHAVAPAIWFIPVEIGGLVIRRRNGLHAEGAARRAAGRMDKVRLARWLLAPISTARIRRRMIIDEERSLAVARARIERRQEVRWALQDRHGRRWRHKASHTTRGLYKRASLDPEALDTLHIGGGPARPEDHNQDEDEYRDAGTAGSEALGRDQSRLQSSVPDLAALAVSGAVRDQASPERSGTDVEPEDGSTGSGPQREHRPHRTDQGQTGPGPSSGPPGPDGPQPTPAAGRARGRTNGHEPPARQETTDGGDSNVPRTGITGPGPSGTAQRNGASRNGTSHARSGPAPAEPDKRTAARKAAVILESRGERITRDAMRAVLRDELGIRISNSELGPLVAEAKAHLASRPDTESAPT